MFASFVGLLWGHGRLKEESIRLQVGLGQLIQVIFQSNQVTTNGIMTIPSRDQLQRLKLPVTVTVTIIMKILMMKFQFSDLKLQLIQTRFPF